MAYNDCFYVSQFLKIRTGTAKVQSKQQDSKPKNWGLFLTVTLAICFDVWLLYMQAKQANAKSNPVSMDMPAPVPTAVCPSLHAQQ